MENREETTRRNNTKWFGGNAFADCTADPEFQQIAQRFLCGEVLNETTLTDTQKALIMLVALTTCQTTASIADYTQAALNVGTKPEEIKEALYQCAPYIGLEKVRCALTEVNKAFTKAGVTESAQNRGTVNDETRFADGLAVQQDIFGVGHINAMRAAAPAELKTMQDYLSAYCFGDFYTRTVLDVRMRELVTFCAICCLGGCEPQAKAHVGANISIGNTRKTLIAAIIQCLPLIGFPRTLNAISCIDAVTQA